MRFILFFFFFLKGLLVLSQPGVIYPFWKSDSLLQQSYLKKTQEQKKVFISAAGEEHKDQYKSIYENHFAGIEAFWKNSAVVTDAEVHDYLQQIVNRIMDSNPELKALHPRVVFTRDDWPNAYSMGDGSIAFNGGLLVRLKNEAEMVFVLCHELAHYYLDHSNRSIRNLVHRFNSKEVQDEIKRLSKQEYRAMQQLEEFMKKWMIGTRRHSRDHEVEADSYAFRFMKNTGYDISGIESCLLILDQVDEHELFSALDCEKIFHFEEYPFNRKWIEKTSSIFSQMKADDGPLTRAEKDSLRTHPDCSKRISILKDSIDQYKGGQSFLVNEGSFGRIQQGFIPEMIEQHFRNGNINRNLYYSMKMLQQNQNLPLAIYSIARDLNLLYEKQKSHTIGTQEKENRFFSQDYNLLLRIIDRWRLEDIATIAYLFCKKYEKEMAGYEVFMKELEKARKYYITELEKN